MHPLSQRTFWLALGLAGGLLLANLTQPTLVSATGSTSFYEEYRCVTGQSYDGEIDLLWILDYRTGRLHCVSLNRTGKLGAIAELDLLQQFELPEGTRGKPHFMMVAGKYTTGRTDFVYLVETSSGQVLCVAPPGAPGRRVGANAQAAAPQVVDRFEFRRDKAAKKADR